MNQCHAEYKSNVTICKDCNVYLKSDYEIQENDLKSEQLKNEELPCFPEGLPTNENLKPDKLIDEGFSLGKLTDKTSESKSTMGWFAYNIKELILKIIRYIGEE